MIAIGSWIIIIGVRGTPFLRRGFGRSRERNLEKVKKVTKSQAFILNLMIGFILIMLGLGVLFPEIMKYLIFIWIVGIVLILIIYTWTNK